MWSRGQEAAYRIIELLSMSSSTVDVLWPSLPVFKTNFPPNRQHSKQDKTNHFHVRHEMEEIILAIGHVSSYTRQAVASLLMCSCSHSSGIFYVLWVIL